jgi:hypothetical protein
VPGRARARQESARPTASRRFSSRPCRTAHQIQNGRDVGGRSQRKMDQEIFLQLPAQAFSAAGAPVDFQPKQPTLPVSQSSTPAESG